MLPIPILELPKSTVIIFGIFEDDKPKIRYVKKRSDQDDGDSKNEVLEFLVPKEMVSASSVRLFVLWTTLPSVVLIIIALIFLKNQTKPLVKLAKAAERFGKGDYVNDFRASG